jgi:hypothetical protein
MKGGVFTSLSTVIKYVIPLSRLIDFCTNSESGGRGRANYHVLVLNTRKTHAFNKKLLKQNVFLTCSSDT